MGQNRVMTELRTEIPSGRRACLPALALLAVILATACGGPRVVTGKPPWIDVDGLVMEGASVTLALRVGNPNDRGIHLAGYRLRGRLDEQELFSTDGSLDIDVSARGRERVEIRLDPAAPGLARLRELDDGERTSMPFRLEGEIRIDDSRNLDVNYRTYLHPAPGRPGHFR